MCNLKNSTSKSSARTSDNKNDRIPFVARIWWSIYKASPKLYLSYKKERYDVGFMLLSAVVLSVIKILLHYVVFDKLLKWPSDDVETHTTRTWYPAGCMTGAVHSMHLVPSLGVLLWWAATNSTTQQTKSSYRQWTPSAPMSIHPVWFQEVTTAMLQMCTGYMIQDFVWNIVGIRWWEASCSPFSLCLNIQLTDDDVAFFIHHVMTVLYMSQCRFLQAGHISAMMCMFCGELTNPLFNSFLVSNMAKELEEVAVGCCRLSGTFQAMIDIPLSIIFLAMRGFLGPLCMLVVTYDLCFTKNARQTIPWSYTILWNIMIWLVTLGGLPWIFSFRDLLLSYVGSETVPSSLKESEL